MPKLPVLSAKELLRLLLKYGCVLVSIEGSHFKVKNPNTGAIAIIPIHGNRDIHKGFMLKILNQLGISTDSLF